MSSEPGKVGTLRQLFALMTKRERWQFVLLVPVLMLGSFLEVLGIGLIPAFLGAAIDPDSFAKIPFLGPPLADLGRGNPMGLLRWGALAVGGVFLLKNSFQILRTYLISKYGKGRQVSLGIRLFRAYQHAPMESLFARNNAIILRTVNVDVQMLANNVLLGLAQIIIASFSIAGIIGLVLLTEWRVAVPLVLLAGIVGCLYVFILNPRSAKVGQAAMEARTGMVRELNESLGSLRETRVMSLEQFQAQRIQSAMKINAQSQVSQAVMAGIATPLLETLAVAGILGTIVLLVSSPDDLVQLVPLLALVILSLARMRAYVTRLFDRWNALSFRLPQAQAVINDIRGFEAAATARAPVDPQPFQFLNAIELRDVTYKYPSAEEATVRNANFRILRGEVLAITGKTGSGKSTLVDLILGVLRPQQGSITIDGVPVHEIETIRKHVGYVPQFIHLYDDTVRNNVALGVKPSKISDESIWESLELAQAADFVRDHPEGLDLLVGENGSRLSGGQRQRLGIARALYHQPEILVFDEGTSALDNTTEQALMDSIRSLSGKVTIILVAHRLRTLGMATRFIELDAAEIREVESLGVADP